MVDDVVVVDEAGGVAWQTEIVTVLPVGTWAPAAGFCASTVFVVAPPGQEVSKVVLATSPAAAMACCAEPASCPTTPGTVAQRPVEITTETAVFGGTGCPACGF